MSYVHLAANDLTSSVWININSKNLIRKKSSGSLQPFRLSDTTRMTLPVTISHSPSTSAWLLNSVVLCNIMCSMIKKPTISCSSVSNVVKLPLRKLIGVDKAKFAWAYITSMLLVSTWACALLWYLLFCLLSKKLWIHLASLTYCRRGYIYKVAQNLCSLHPIY